jgi:hypothetical protein
MNKTYKKEFFLQYDRGKLSVKVLYWYKHVSVVERTVIYVPTNASAKRLLTNFIWVISH